jgi:predicted DNA-binding protein (UPF0251 family)
MSDREVHLVLGAIAELKAQHNESTKGLLERIAKLEDALGAQRRHAVDPLKVYTTEQASRFLGISKYTLWKRVQAGLVAKLPQPAGSNAIRIKGTEILRLLGDGEAS